MVRKSRSSIAAACAYALLMAPVAPLPALAQSAGAADVVATCGTPNSTYVAGAGPRPLTQNTGGQGCSSGGGIPTFGPSPGQPSLADVVASCGTPNSTYVAGNGPRPVTMDTTGTLC